MLQPQPNALLSLMDARAMEQVGPHFRTARLRRGDVLARTDEPVQQVYFLHSGAVSCLVELESGSSIETGTIGRDGEFGAGQAIYENLSLTKVVVQIAGTASVMDADRLRRVTDSLPAFRKLLMRYEQFLLAQVQQMAACNAVHAVRARLCRWLLRLNELTGPDLPLTQESMAQMLGVRRTTVTQIAGELHKAGLIWSNRGHVRIEDVGRVVQLACECHHAVQHSHKLIFQDLAARSRP